MGRRLNVCAVLKLISWKQCAPGVRMSCDALHCGRRPYLHDDLETVRLSKDLIAAPPIELWPRIVARVLLPEDVEQGLISHLQTSEVSETSEV
jgi:hypothetical protein